jgi:hypothetical protein
MSVRYMNAFLKKIEVPLLAWQIAAAAEVT